MTRATTEERTENGLVRYFRETRAELGKVAWPTREEGTRLTTIVFITTIISAVFIFGIDILFQEIIRLILQASS